jgi:hypothetical protein
LKFCCRGRSGEKSDPFVKDGVLQQHKTGQQP